MDEALRPERAAGVYVRKETPVTTVAYSYTR